MESSPAPSNRWLIAIAVALGALMEAIDTSIVNVALVNIQASVGATLNQVSWVVTGYSMAKVIVLPLSAWIGFHFGSKRHFLVSLLGFTLASLLCGIAPSLPLLILARVLQGFTGGGLQAKGQAILYETFSRKEQPMAQALFGAMMIAGPTIGPTLGGYIVTNHDWRWVFLINIPIGIGAALLCKVVLPSGGVRSMRPVRTDWLAIVLLMVGLGSLQIVLEEGRSQDWFDSGLIASLALASALALICFVWRSLETPHPVVDLHVLQFPSLWAGCLMSAILGLALFGTLFAVPIFAQSVLHYTPEQTGYLLLPSALLSAACMPIVGRLNRRINPRILVSCGFVLLIVAVAELAQLSASTSERDLGVPLAIRAIGTSLVFMPLTLSTLGPIPRERVAEAAGIYNLTRQLGGSLGVAALATILSSRQAVHRAILVPHLDPGSPVFLHQFEILRQRVVAHGFPASSAQRMATAIVDARVGLQSAVLSFNDTFMVTLVLLLAAIPLIAMLGAASGAPTPPES